MRSRDARRSSRRRTPTPFELLGAVLRRLMLLGVAVAAAAWLAAAAYYGPEPVLTPEESLAGPDEADRSVYTTPTRSGAEDHLLTKILGELPAKSSDPLAAIQAISAALRSRRAGSGQYGFAAVEPLPATAVSLGELAALWPGWIATSDVATATLALHACDRAGLRARLLRTRSGPGPWARGFAGLEIWYPRQRSWVLFDPRNGVIVNTPEFYLSLADVRRLQASGQPIQVTPLDLVTAVSPLGHPPAEYVGRLADAWVATGDGKPLPRGAAIRWRPYCDRHSSLLFLGLTKGRRLGFGAFVAYAVLVLFGVLVPRAARSREPSEGKTDQRTAGDGRESLPREPRGGALHEGLGLIRELGGCVARDASAIAGTIGRGLREALRFGIAFLAGAAAGAGRRLSHGAAAGARLAALPLARSGARLWRESAAAVQTVLSRRAPVASRRPVAVLGLASVASAVLMVQLVQIEWELHEDAYISLRYARNLAAGWGFTFNPGEPGVEGVSNFLWVLILALGGALGGSIPGLAMSLGIGLGVATLGVAASMAAEAGAFAFLPLLLLSTNSCFVHNCATGLETALACFLTLLLARAWIRDGDEDPAAMRRTSLIAFAYGMARVDGWFVFLGITLFRFLGSPRERWLVLARSWLAPFLAAYAVLTLTRVVAFGSPVPFIYYGRLLEQRGALLERVIPGIVYVASFFVFNPAFLAVAASFRRRWLDARTARLAAIAAIHVVLQILVGGDVDHIGYSRFMVPASGPLALMSQALCARAASGALAAGFLAPLAVALALACNAATVPFPRATQADAPLYETASWLHLGRENGRFAREDLHHGWLHLVSRVRGTMPRSFDTNVSRHLAASSTRRRSLSASQAGHMAYTWPWTFWDHGGLATPRHEPFGDLASALEVTDYWLVGHHEYHRIGDSLGIRRVYIDDWGAPIGPLSVYLLCTPPGPDTISLRIAPRMEDGNVAWWRLPAKYFVVFGGDSEKPLWDGARDPADSAVLSKLRHQGRRWLRGAAR